MKRPGTKRLETPRLVLRRFTMNDAKKMYRNWAGDGLVTKYLSWPTHESEADSEAVPREWICLLYTSGRLREAAGDQARAFSWFAGAARRPGHGALSRLRRSNNSRPYFVIR